MKKTIIFTGGGTGGHIWPLVPLIKRLKDNYRIKYYGQSSGKEAGVADKLGVDFRSIKSAKLQGWSFLNPLTYFYQLIGIYQSLSKLLKDKPDIIFAKGGFVSFPVVLAGYFLGIRVVVHESDSVIGRANRFLMPMTFRFLVNFPTKFYNYCSSKIIRVGIPVRGEFRPTKLPHRKRVLFYGGSQGSVFINQMAKELVSELVKKDIEVIHICGRKNLAGMKDYYDSLEAKVQDNYQLYGFSNKIAQLIKDASLVVSRAGATSLVEVAHIKRPLIMIPFPFAASDHQYYNAKIVQDVKAGKMMIESNTNSEKLKKEILNLLDDLDKRKKLANNLNDLLALNSNDRIIKIIQSII